MFYPLGKNLEKTQGRVATIPPPPVLPSVNHDPSPFLLFQFEILRYNKPNANVVIHLQSIKFIK